MTRTSEICFAVVLGFAMGIIVSYRHETPPLTTSTTICACPSVVAPVPAPEATGYTDGAPLEDDEAPFPQTPASAILATKRPR